MARIQRDTHTHSTTMDYRVWNFLSFRIYCMVFTVLCLFLCACVGGWTGCPCSMLSTHTHRLIFYSMFVSPVWLTTQNHSTLVTERSAVPFLPVNPEYSATRNQVKHTHTHSYAILQCWLPTGVACIFPNTFVL